MADEPLPMDNLTDPAADAEPSSQADVQPGSGDGSDRARDEGGRFTSGDGKARGLPNAEAARRREAQQRDQFRAERDDFKGKYEALDRRLKDMASVFAGDDPNAPAKADPIAELAGKVDQIGQRLQQGDEQRQAVEHWNQVRSFADADEARFREQQPDFPNAAQHYITSRLSEMKALGFEQDQAEQALRQEAQTLLSQCAQSGRSPAEALFMMAQARGYQPGAASSPPPPLRPSGGRSLGTGSGPAGGGLTAAQIGAMDEADYMRFRSTPEGKAAIRRAMGG